MNRTPQQEFQELDAYYQGGKFEDMPLSNDFLECFQGRFDQATTPGYLPSPNSSNPDLPGSGRQSPLLPYLSPFPDRYGPQPTDGIEDADNDFFDSSFLQQPQKSHENTDSNTVNSPLCTNRSSSDASNRSSRFELQQGEPSQTFTASSEDPPYNSNGLFQSHAAAELSTGSFEEFVPVGKLTSTQRPIAPNTLQNTPSTSVPANLQQHSSTAKSHFVRHPSHLRHQIHPGQSQYSLSTLTASNTDTTGQVPHEMSSDYRFINHQEHNVAPSHSNYQYVQPCAGKPSFRRFNDAHNQNRGSSVSQNYQPFEESSLRASATSNTGQHHWEAGLLENPQQYPDPESMHLLQSSGLPYTGHHYIAGFQENSLVSCLPEQHPHQSSDAHNFGLGGSSPMSVKRETPSADSDYVASSPNSKSQTVSPQPQKKQRLRQGSKNNDDNVVAIGSVALQTADLTELNPRDQINLAALIDAMQNTDEVEDNVGMQKTWQKVRRIKAHRIKEVCLSLLNLTKEAQRIGTPLGDKKPINQYASFEKRFDALCETLRFQKTVCKHLIEPPYSYGVVDDPQSAKERVKNNRRVNYQKAEAIRLGREHLGEKGQGKGKPMLRMKKRAHGQIEDGQDDEDNSGDESLSDGETNGSSLGFGSKSARSNSGTPKKARPRSRSYQPIHGPMVHSSPSGSANHNQYQEQSDSVPVSHQPHVPHPDDPFDQVLQQDVDAFAPQTQMCSEHNRMPHGFAADHRMPGFHQQCDYQPHNGAGRLYYGDPSIGNNGGEGPGDPSYGYR